MRFESRESTEIESSSTIDAQLSISRRSHIKEKPRQNAWAFPLYGSPHCLKARTFRFTFVIPPRQTSAKLKLKKTFKNPILIALAYQKKLTAGEFSSQAELARKLGTTRMRVNQLLRLLQLNPTVIQAIKRLGEPLHSRVVTERTLRQLVKLPFSEQEKHLQLKGVKSHEQ